VEKFAGLDGDLKAADLVVVLPLCPELLLHVLQDLRVGFD
jgi:hypothetical protein